MKTTYDIYNRLHQSSMTGVEYISDTNSIIYNASEYSVKVYEIGKVFHVVIIYEGYEYPFTAPDCDNVYNLLSGFYNKEISINQLSDIYIKLKGYNNKKEKRYSKMKTAVLSVIGILMGLFSLMMCLALPIGSLLFDEKFDFGLMTVDFIFIAILLISISLVKYAVLQNKYKRRIWMVGIGYALIGFFSNTSSLMLIEDYDKANGYSIDTIGAFGVMLLGVLFGVVFLVFSKRNQGEKSLLLIRDAVLPDTADADAIFRYMEEVCSHDKLSIDELCSTGRDYDDDDDEKKYIFKFQVRQIDDRKILKMLNPVFIWLISNFVLLAIVCNATQTIAMAAVLLMITNFVMIIPIFIILRKKSAEYRKSQFKTINAEFEVKDDKVYLNGREAVITFFHAEDGIQVLSVSMLFDKFSGYALMDTEIEAFVKFAAENRFPINVKGCTYPKNK